MDLKSKPSMMLHCCCAPCMTHPIKKLEEDFHVTVFFFNPNIHPIEEYGQRRDETKHLAEKWGFPIIIGEYNKDDWFEMVKGCETEPEGGQRCEMCYHMRLEQTAQTAKEKGIDFFTTTLSISPHKKAAIINRIGKEIENVWDIKYYEVDFKKKDGFKISCQLSEEEGLYRQNYCGCIFSRSKI